MTEAARAADAGIRLSAVPEGGWPKALAAALLPALRWRAAIWRAVHLPLVEEGKGATRPRVASPGISNSSPDAEIGRRRARAKAKECELMTHLPDRNRDDIIIMTDVDSAVNTLWHPIWAETRTRPIPVDDRQVPGYSTAAQSPLVD
jgi:hypothetical protein